MLFICLSFNTQPPEGGWVLCSTVCTTRVSFNTQPPEGGWTYFSNGEYSDCDVSTHSRPKAAGHTSFNKFVNKLFQHTAARRRLGSTASILRLFASVSTHSRPKAAGSSRSFFVSFWRNVSTHSRPKAAGANRGVYRSCFPVSTHSRPKAAGIEL